MTNPPLQDGTTAPGMMTALLRFTVAQVMIVIACVFVMQTFVWTDAPSVQALHASAWLAVIVQTFTFAIAKLVARQQVIAGWGLGVLLRFASVAFWALLGIKALGLVAGPALLSLVVFYFLSTLVEPLFLN
ncbi:MAG TPA: hypothetical protein VGE27_05760 [Gemmatimonas sp.]|uniref:hypothetical protein n=1 Tax=Gemmatimonas sp. TaxID=1962908 RepID=UPI002EDA2740